MSDIPLLPFETVPLNATTSSTSVAFKKSPAAQGSPDVMVTNEGSNTAFLAFGNSKGGTVTITAQLPGITGTTGCTPILSGAIMTLRKGDADTCAAITRAGSTQLYFTAGNGS